MSQECCCVGINQHSEAAIENSMLILKSISSRDERRGQNWNVLCPYCHREHWIKVLARLEAGKGVVGLDRATIIRTWILRLLMSDHSWTAVWVLVRSDTDSRETRGPKAQHRCQIYRVLVHGSRSSNAIVHDDI